MERLLCIAINKRNKPPSFRGAVLIIYLQQVSFITEKKSSKKYLNTQQKHIQKVPTFIYPYPTIIYFVKKRLLN